MVLKLIRNLSIFFGNKHTIKTALLEWTATWKIIMWPCISTFNFHEARTMVSDALIHYFQCSNSRFMSYLKIFCKGDKEMISWTIAGTHRIYSLTSEEEPIIFSNLFRLKQEKLMSSCSKYDWITYKNSVSFYVKA